jgi:membrane protease YdiL (CAAX protease family)
VVCLVLAIPFELGFGAVMVASLLYPSTDPYTGLGWSPIGYAIGLLVALLMAIASVLAIRSLVGELRGRPSRPLRGRRLIGWILSLGIGLPCLVFWLSHLPEDWESFIAWAKPTPLLLAFLLAPWIARMEEDPAR